MQAYILTILVGVFYIAYGEMVGLDRRIAELSVRMKMAGDEDRIAATRELIQLVLNTDNQRRILDSEAFLFTIAQLHSTNSALRIASLHVFGILGSTLDNQSILASIEIIPTIISLIGSGSDEQSLAAIQTIGNLAHSAEIQAQVGEADGAAHIAKYLLHDSEKVRRVTAGVLGNLAIHEPNCRRIKDAGAIPLLIALASAQDNAEATTAEIALSALRNLLADETLIDDLIDANIIPTLARLRRDGNEATQEIAANLMDFLAMEVAELGELPEEEL